MREVSIREFNSASPEKLRAVLNGPPGEAARWLHTAAEHGVVEAQVHYAQMLLDGRGVPADAPQAFQWFKLAANQGHVMAMNMTGRCYENGWGVPPDAVMASYWFRLAAHAGLDWGMYNYATSLALGRGVELDRQEALVWLRKAVALGHAKSWNLLGGFHEDGWTGEVDMDAALDCYLKAAEGGDFRGQFNVGRLLAGRADIAPAQAWMARAYRNRGATAAFKKKMLGFLRASQSQALRDLAAALAHG